MPVLAPPPRQHAPDAAVTPDARPNPFDTPAPAAPPRHDAQLREYIAARRSARDDCC